MTITENSWFISWREEDIWLCYKKKILIFIYEYLLLVYVIVVYVLSVYS